MERNLLIHSMSEFSGLTLPILEAINATTVCEIGAEHGGNSKVLNEWLQKNNGTLISIDPNPSPDFLNWAPSSGVKHIAKNSHIAIPEVKTADAWFIDGDHNWYTVFNELNKIREHARKENKPLLIFMHDVGWPWARRDLYYAPDQIPEKFRQPFTFDEGVTLDVPVVIRGGFRSHGAYAIALHEGGPRNGVLTAIDDFLKLYPKEFCFANIPAVFGLGILFDFNHPFVNQIIKIVAPFHENALLHSLEMNRLANYLKVIQLQDENTYATAPKPAHSPAAPTAPITDNFSHSNDVEKYEKMALSIINALEDEQDHPEIWNAIDAISKEKTELKNFVDYLNMLLSIPQDEKAIKIISVIQAMCLTQLDDRETARAILQALNKQHGACSLVQGAIARLVTSQVAG